MKKKAEVKKTVKKKKTKVIEEKEFLNDSTEIRETKKKATKKTAVKAKKESSAKTKKVSKEKKMSKKTNEPKTDKAKKKSKKTEEIEEIKPLSCEEIFHENQETPSEESGNNKFKREPKKTYKGTLLENKVYLFDKTDGEEIYDYGCFGKIKDDKNELSLEEALVLAKRNKLKIYEDEKELNVEEFYEYACRQDKEFIWKFTVYEELRGRGLLVRTGFKFGTHFRVYARGVKLKRGPKSVREHTKWIVHAIPENYACSFPELSRAVRLAHNIRAKMLWAVVDDEGDVTYYEIIRKTP
ncbi:MAG: tRNA-intron lyase [Candidatus Aenigmatarchaeota archaeon]|nr:MAG: tRNA-intron lyase [Candidatus Aenigmarchaeota archaeon]